MEEICDLIAEVFYFFVQIPFLSTAGFVEMGAHMSALWHRTSTWYQVRIDLAGVCTGLRPIPGKYRSTPYVPRYVRQFC